MKILLDEKLDRRLRAHLDTHQVFTVVYLGWQGVKNGKLLQAAEESGFDLLLTGDQSLPYEQNLSSRHLAVIAMSSVEWQIIQHHLPEILAAIERIKPGTFQFVQCGSFSRKSAKQEEPS